MQGKEKAAAGRSRILVATLAGIALVEAATIMQMMPLKERVPYFVEVEQTTGRVAPSDRAAKTFVADENNKRYFIKDWVQAMFSIDPARTKAILLPRAKTMTRGKATNQYSEWLDRDQTLFRMVEDSELSRSIELRSISFVPGAENVAIIRALFHTEGKYGGRKTEGKVITATFALVPPETDEEILRNPIGLFITEFNVDSEVVQ
jgi:type IV secretory pathway component VirB8